MRFVSLPHFVGVVGLCIFPCVMSSAQDLDLDIPGLEEEAASPAPSAEASTGTVAEGETTLLTMIKQGGWAMWPLGAFPSG